MAKKRGLGKNLNDLGIAALLSDIQAEHKTELRKLPIDIMQPGKYQPRKDMDQQALVELADSIRAQGIIQPIVVRPITNNRYEIIAGERRWRAAQMAQLHEIPAVIRDIRDEAAIAMALIENIQRENLNAIEEATALQRLIAEFNMTHEEVAGAVGKSRTTITNLLRLLSLSPEVKTMLEHGDLEMGHARALLTLTENLQIQAAKTVVAKDLSVRATEHLTHKLQQPTKTTEKIADPNILQLQQNLSDKLGAHIIIHHNNKGNGKLVIKYNSLEELEGIIERIED
jgi:ParB family chromosome partitioning protein